VVRQDLVCKKLSYFTTITGCPSFEVSAATYSPLTKCYLNKCSSGAL